MRGALKADLLAKLPDRVNSIRVRMQFVSILMSGLCLALLDIPTLIDIWPTISLAALFTGVWLVLWLMSGINQLTSFALIALLVLLGIASWLSGEAGVEHAQYLMILVVLASGFIVAISPVNKSGTKNVLFWGASCAAILIALTPFFQLPISRAGQVTAGLVIAALLTSRPKRIPMTWVAVLVILILVGLYFSTARMASLVSILTILVWLSIASRGWIWARISTGILLVLSSVFVWIALPSARARLFQGDAALELGGVTLNTEGRVSAVRTLVEAGAVDHVAFSTTNGLTWHSIAQIVFGQGIGIAGQRLEDADFPLDKPHNEYLRMWIDGGVIGVSLLVTMVLVLIVMSVRLLRKACASEAFITASIVISLIFFSLTDNILSYSWFAVPAATLVALANQSLLRETSSEKSLIN